MPEKYDLIKVVKNIFWLGLEHSLRLGLGLIVGIWLVRYLGPENFGVMSYSLAITGLFSAIAALGMRGIAIREIVRHPDQKFEILGTSATLQILGGLVSYAMAISSVFLLRPNDPLAIAFVAIAGSALLFKLSETADYWLESQLMSKYSVWIRSGCFAFFSMVKVYLILIEADLISFAYVIVAEALAVTLVYITVILLSCFKMSKIHFVWVRAKDMLLAGCPLMLTGISMAIYMKIDQIMLGQMLGNTAVGIYAAAVRLSELWLFIPLIIANSVLPGILEAQKNSAKLYLAKLQQLFDILVWIALVIILIITLTADELVILIFGQDFKEAGKILSIHIWAIVFAFLGLASGKWFLAEDRQILGLKRALLGMAVNIALNLRLIPEYGGLGAAWATLLSQASAAMLFDLTHAETRKIFWMKLSALNPIAALRRTKLVILK